MTLRRMKKVQSRNATSKETEELVKQARKLGQATEAEEEFSKDACRAVRLREEKRE